MEKFRKTTTHISHLNLALNFDTRKEKANGNFHYRLNFDPGMTNKIFYHSLKEHVKISKIVKFGCEMLYNEKNMASRSLRICIQMYYARESLPFWYRFCLKSGRLFRA